MALTVLTTVPLSGSHQLLRAQAAPLAGTVFDQARCTALTGRVLGGARIVGAEVVAAGAVAGKDLGGLVKAPVAICRVRAIQSPEPGSEINIEAWLPADWNGKMLGTGGGGLNGGLGNSTADLSHGVSRGYAGIINDAGHETSSSAKWAYQHAGKVVDYGYRANHLAAIVGKAIVAAYYARPPRRSYFQGCSNGGRDALMLAQRNPDDYDGIVAGAPASNMTGLLTMAMWNAQRVHRLPEAATLPSKLDLLREGAVRKCDRLDGVADGIIGNPMACRFDPSELQCRPGSKTGSCLTAGEVAIAREIYAGPRTSTGKRVMFGLLVGSESDPASRGWAPFITPDGVGGTVLGGEFFRWIVFGQPDWKASSFSLDRDYEAAKVRASSQIDATDPDISAFARRGGKLLMYHGWEDSVIPATSSIDYYEAARRRLGRRYSSNVRLFVLPGASHCTGGHGPSVFDKLDLIDAWVERGSAPRTIVARKYDDDAAALAGRPATMLRSGLICPWPSAAHYSGSGRTDDAANYRCTVPKAQRS